MIRTAFALLCALALLVTSIATSPSASAQTQSPVQSSARPLGLQPIQPVMLSGSDARSQTFNQVHLPIVLGIITDHLVSGRAFDGRGSFKLDADKLFMPQAANQTIRIYFIDEGAGYHNSLGFDFTQAGDPNPGQAYLIFPDASKPAASGQEWMLGVPQYTRRASDPLKTGDFVDIGVGGAGWQLGLFLISNGASGGNVKLWNDKSLNVDGIQHMVAFQIPNTNLLLVGFEDLIGGGDLDFEDTLFVVDIGFDYQTDLNLPN
ncbi:MAG: DUF4114 domain-containing protein [Pirellulales bacterium]